MTEEHNKLVDAYENFSQRTKDIMEESQDKTSQALDNAMEKAREILVKAKELTNEESERVKIILGIVPESRGG
jgi:hypothetical protein